MLDWCDWTADYDLLCQIEFHPYVYKDLQPTLELLKQHGITVGSFGGLSPIVRFKGGPVDPVLESIAKRLSAETGKPVSETQVLYLWQREKGAVIVTCVPSKQSPCD